MVPKIAPRAAARTAMPERPRRCVRSVMEVSRWMRHGRASPVMHLDTVHSATDRRLLNSPSRTCLRRPLSVVGRAAAPIADFPAQHPASRFRRPAPARSQCAVRAALPRNRPPMPRWPGQRLTVAGGSERRPSAPALVRLPFRPAPRPPPDGTASSDRRPGTPTAVRGPRSMLPGSRRHRPPPPSWPIVLGPLPTSRIGRRRGLNVEAEVHHVAVVHQVALALDPDLAGRLGGGH